MFDRPSNLGIFRTTIAFLQIPVFYLYVLSVSYSDFKLKPKYLLHAVPFLIVNAVLVPRFYAVDDASKLDFIINRKSMIELQFIHVLIHVQIIVYFAAIFMLLKRAKKAVSRK
jgi:membrane protease YdiL (CAAX protease family)